MKKVILCVALLGFVSCEALEEVASNVQSSTNTNTLSNTDVIAGLKEALNVGIKNAVNLTTAADGFLKNDAIRLPFPEDAIKVKQKAIDLGLASQVEKFESTLNHAAEEATKEALPIFMEAIKNMTIQDGFTILNGGNGAATKFLKDNTNAKLTAAFKPKVEAAIAKVKLTEYWNPIITKYNSAMTFTGGQKLNPDLNTYVTERAIAGLFKLVEQEENKIRKDPTARISTILVKVFGSIAPTK